MTSKMSICSSCKRHFTDEECKLLLLGGMGVGGSSDGKTRFRTLIWRCVCGGSVTQEVWREGSRIEGAA